VISSPRFPPPWIAEETDACFIVRDDVVLETAEKKGCAEHEKRVGHNGAGYGTLHQRIFPWHGAPPLL
jgi:hypothetical protein